MVMPLTLPIAKRLLRPELSGLSSYNVVNSSGYVKLDAMENPYPWPEKMVTAWLDQLRFCQPNRYPDPSASALKAKIRARNDVPADKALLLGNGSDELIQIILMAVANENAVVVAPEPGFVMYKQIATGLGMRYTGVPLKPDSFQLDMEAMTRVLMEQKPAVVFLAYPNNPTGNLFADQDMLDVLRFAPALVVVDEAYSPFAEASFMNRLSEYSNLLVMRTVSKLGLAGLRLGFLVGHQEWLDELDKLRLPYNVNVLTQISTEFALDNYAVFESQTRQIREDREQLFRRMNALPGITVYPSRANFLLFHVDGLDADRVFSGLKNQGILIKNMHSAGGLVDNCLRVTVGTSDENHRFMVGMEQVLGISGNQAS